MDFVTRLSVTVLGCSGSYAAAGTACSGYLIRSATTSIWVDCGPGTVANIQEHIDLADIDALMISHHHPDHCAELPVIYNAFKWFIGRTSVPTYAPIGVLGVTEAMSGPTGDVFAWTVIDETSRVSIGDIEVRFARTDHPVETLAMRFDCDGESIVYTADTANGWDPAELALGADVLVGEATVLDADLAPETPHMSAAQIAAAAERSGVATLLMTHLAPGSEAPAFVAEAEANTTIPVVLAVSGLVMAARRPV